MANRLMVVSDDPSLHDEAHFSLSGAFEIAAAGDAREAIIAMRSRRPTVVLVDIQSGSAGGFALARDMTFEERLRDVPIVMLLERAQDVWLAQQAGARIIRVKPVDMRALVAEIEELVAK